MKRLQITILTAMLLMIQPVAAQADTAKLLAEISGRTTNTLAMVRCTLENEAGSQAIAGQGICIDPSGVFMTLALSPRLQVDSLKNFALVIPGVEGETIKAELLGIDELTGIGFVRAVEPHKWSAIRFEQRSELSAGQQVASVGLLPSDTGYAPYLGAGYVSAMIRRPEQLVYVAGGKLTCVCSPVFTADARVVGIVGPQPFGGYEMVTARGTVSLRLRNQQETTYFMPVEEFVHVLSDIPAPDKPQRLPWLGVLKFEGVGKDLAELMRLDRPGVMIDQVIASQPAAKAGLKDRDIIVAIDGQNLQRLPTSDLTARNFVKTLMRLKIGQEITLVVQRGTELKSVTLKLEAMPVRPTEAKRYFNEALGLTVRERVMLDRYLVKSSTADVPGLLVVYLQKDGPASKAGLEFNDIVTGINDQPVRTVASFKRTLQSALTDAPSRSVNLVVHRGDRLQVISIQPSVP